MMGVSKDILNNSDFAIEKMAYHTKISMRNPHFHEHYEILYVHSGERDLILNNATPYTLNNHSVALIPPNVIHSTHAKSNISSSRILINISKPLINELVDFSTEDILLCFKSCILNFSHADAGIISYFFNTLLSASKDDHLYESTVKITLLNLLLHFTKIHNNISTTNNSIQHHSLKIKDNMEMVADYMKANFSQDISLDDVSKKLGMSKGYMIKCFEEYMHISPIKYLNNLRIIHAKRLLESHTTSILDIAHESGFNSNTSFTRVFKQITGMSPKEYQSYYNNLK